MKSIRNICSSDYDHIISKLNDWWGGRPMADMLPKLFFNHFSNTSFIVCDNEETVGFIIGFLSQSVPKKAYVHFVGVHPDYRSQGIGRYLYSYFFREIASKGIKEVECVTSPKNRASIKFHRCIGFIPEPGDDKTDEAIPFRRDYDGPGQDRVVLTFKI